VEYAGFEPTTVDDMLTLVLRETQCEIQGYNYKALAALRAENSPVYEKAKYLDKQFVYLTSSTGHLTSLLSPKSPFLSQRRLRIRFDTKKKRKEKMMAALEGRLLEWFSTKVPGTLLSLRGTTSLSSWNSMKQKSIGYILSSDVSTNLERMPCSRENAATGLWRIYPIRSVA
jgi:hypothetical protein